MKKWAIALSAALVLALSGAALAASNVTISGEMGTQFSVSQQLNAGQQPAKYNSLGWINLGLGTEIANQQVKAVLKLSPWTIGMDDSNGDGLPDGTNFAGLTPVAEPNNGQENDANGQPIMGGLRIDQAYLQTVGSFWMGGPVLTTSIGDVEINKDPLVADLGTQKAVMVEGVPVGPVSADLFYTWPSAAARVMGVAAKANVAGIGLNGTVINNAGKYAWDAGATATVLPGVELKGLVAGDENFQAAPADHWGARLDATVTTLPNVKLTAGVRGQGSKDFKPYYAATDDTRPATDLGFSLGAETQIMGLPVTASYDQSLELHKIVGSLGTTVNVAGLAINGKYTGTYENQALTNELSADTTLNVIPQLPNIKFSGDLQFNTQRVTSYSIGADYTAPNGMDFGLNYANGTASASAGLKMTF